MSTPEPLQQVDRTCVIYKNRRLAYFAGCDYLRLASHPAVLRAAATAVGKYGLNVSASRMTTGNHILYEQLEAALVRFFKVESATLASNGYLPNLMVAQALAGDVSHALIDERAHGCLIDAAQMLGCPTIFFKHRDPADFSAKLKKLRAGKPLLLTDGLFSHDGGIAPLDKYLKLLPGSGLLLLDDSHAAGVLGANGRGTVEHFKLNDARIIRTTTLSKGFGAYGGATLGSHALRAAILKKSRIFVGNTPLPLPLASASLTSVLTLGRTKSLRSRLRKNIAFVQARLPFPLFEPASPVFGLIPASAAHANLLKRNLLAAGIFPPFIKYPGGPPDGYFRFALSSEHTRAQLTALTGAISASF